MQTYIVHWQFPDQESHMQGAEAFAGFVEGGCEGDEFEGFKVFINCIPLDLFLKLKSCHQFL